MNTPVPGGYRIADEIESSSRHTKSPWSPTGLFFLTVLFAPVGGLLYGLNWARLGFAEKRALVFAASVIPLFLSFIVPLAAPALGLSFDRATWRPVMSFLGIAIAYWQLFSQRPYFEAHVARGGERANGWWLWLVALLIILVFVGGAVLRNAR